jgi:hypothetical protein
MAANQKKKHHYTPVTYLKGFADATGRVFAYRKDHPEVALHKLPEDIGFENYYYAQPLPDGGRDSDTLEDFFSTIESPWPQIIERLRTRRETSADFLPLISFLMLQRVRVPCARDAVEIKLAAMVAATSRVADPMGLLPPKPDGHDDILDKLEVSIDPQKSLEAMTDLMRGFERVVDALTFEVLHNQTELDFITSDNPIAVFDPKVPEQKMQPYRLRPDLHSIELLFPLTSRLMLRGTAGLRFKPSVTHVTVASNQEVKRMNRFAARFAYRIVFASSEDHAPLIRKHAAHSPVSKLEHFREGAVGELTLQTSIFGPRPAKPKWRGAS